MTRWHLFGGFLAGVAIAGMEMLLERSRRSAKTRQDILDKLKVAGAGLGIATRATPPRRSRSKSSGAS